MHFDIFGVKYRLSPWRNNIGMIEYWIPFHCAMNKVKQPSPKAWWCNTNCEEISLLTLDRKKVFLRMAFLSGPIEEESEINRGNSRVAWWIASVNGLKLKDQFPGNKLKHFFFFWVIKFYKAIFFLGLVAWNKLILYTNLSFSLKFIS
jgi:hypothetical protein